MHGETTIILSIMAVFQGCYEAFRKVATDVSTGAIVITVLFIITEVRLSGEITA